MCALCSVEPIAQQPDRHVIRSEFAACADFDAAHNAERSQAGHSSHLPERKIVMHHDCHLAAFNRITALNRNRVEIKVIDL